MKNIIRYDFLYQTIIFIVNRRQKSSLSISLFLISQNLLLLVLINFSPRHAITNWMILSININSWIHIIPSTSPSWLGGRNTCPGKAKGWFTCSHSLLPSIREILIIVALYPLNFRNLLSILIKVTVPKQLDFYYRSKTINPSLKDSGLWLILGSLSSRLPGMRPTEKKDISRYISVLYSTYIILR